MKIRYKLLLIVLVIIINFGVIIILSRWAINEISDLKEKSKEGMELVADLRQIKALMSDLQLTYTFDFTYTKFTKAVLNFENLYRAFITSPRLKNLIKKSAFEDNYNNLNRTYLNAFKKINEINKKIIDHRSKGQLVGEGEGVVGSGSENYGLFIQYYISKNDYMLDLLNITKDTSVYFSEIFENNLAPFIASINQTSQNIQNQILLLSLSLTILIAILSTIFVFFFASSLSNRINNVSSFVQKIADGDFTAKIEIKTRDEIFDLTNNIKRIISFENILIQIRNTAKTLNESYLKTKEAVDNVYESINQQASTIDKTTSSFKLLTNSINDIANNALKTNVIALDTKNSIQTSTSQIRDTIKEINVLSQSASKIMGMLKIINSITEQTDLLSLNAAIEAARAGEAGKGFAVVASEIRKLAETSAEATKEVSLLTREIISNIKQTTAKTETSAEALQTMESSIVEVVNLIEEIANATEQESEGSKSIMNSVTNITGLSVKNKENADKIIFNNMYLKREVDQLHNLVSKFKLSELMLEQK